MILLAIPALVVAALVAGVLRTTLGVGAGIFLTATMSLLFEPRRVLGAMAVIQIAFDVSAGYHFRGQWDRRLLRPLIPSTVAGVLVGTWLVATAPGPTLRTVMGVGLVAYTALQLVREWQQGGESRGAGLGAAVAVGILSGAASALVNVSGVILALYLQRIRLPQGIFLGTLTATQFVQDIIKLVAYRQVGLLGVEEVGLSLPFIPLIFVGGVIGMRLNRYISPVLFGRLLLVFVLLSGVRLLW